MMFNYCLKGRAQFVGQNQLLQQTLRGRLNKTTSFLTHPGHKVGSENWFSSHSGILTTVGLIRLVLAVWITIALPGQPHAFPIGAPKLPG